MKQKFVLFITIGILATTGCKSRFTSTSDSTGPRRHIYANPSTKNNNHSLKDAEHTLDDPQKSLSEIRDSGSAPILSREDSISSLSDTKLTDTSKNNSH